MLDVTPLQQQYRWRNKLIYMSCFGCLLHWWHNTRFNCETLNAYYLLCFVEEVISIIWLCIAIIDFVNNCIWSFAHIYWKIVFNAYEVLTHCKHILVVFVLSRKQVHHQWIFLLDYLTWAAICERELLWLGLLPFSLSSIQIALGTSPLDQPS